jgi:DNA-binding transcriptional MerR regulator
MQKAPDAFRTISEVAEQLDVPQHVLRFWETRFSQIRPMKRAGGRRYYRPQDVDLLRGIRKLLYDDGYTIKGVQKILREHGIAHVIAIGRGELDTSPPAARAMASSATAAPAVTDGGEAKAAGGEEATAGATTPAGAAASAAASTAATAERGLSDAEKALLGKALEELEAASELLEKALSEQADSSSGGQGAA